MNARIWISRDRTSDYFCRIWKSKPEENESAGFYYDDGPPHRNKKFICNTDLLLVEPGECKCFELSEVKSENR